MLNSAIFAYGTLLFANSVTGAAIALSLTPPENVSQPVLESFVSFSIEFSSFPDFAGKSKRNRFLIRSEGEESMDQSG